MKVRGPGRFCGVKVKSSLRCGVRIASRTWDVSSSPEAAPGESLAPHRSGAIRSPRCLAGPTRPSPGWCCLHSLTDKQPALAPTCGGPPGHRPPFISESSHCRRIWRPTASTERFQVGSRRQYRDLTRLTVGQMGRVPTTRGRARTSAARGRPRGRVRAPAARSVASDRARAEC
jgi:hypothetical protein